MTINLIGLVAGVATFLGIWFGHVTVRKVEATAPKLWLPIVVSLILGLGLEYGSLISENLPVKTATGILGVTLLWDSFEFWRQQKRIQKGHAPANPENPRHARILAAYESATNVDLLDRDPIGRPVGAKEAIQLVAVNTGYLKQ
jgi:hypothetical protein